MKKIIMMLLMSIIVFVGCSKGIETSVKDTQENKEVKEKVSQIDYSSYLGLWSLENNDEYLMTALQSVFGEVTIDIQSIEGNKAKVILTSISGAPSFRIAEVVFEGEIKENKLVADYKDEGWEYTGTVTLEFNDHSILANVTRDKSDNQPMWAIIEGEYAFVRPIHNKIIEMDHEYEIHFKEILLLINDSIMKPFKEGELKDESIIYFVGMNLATSNIDYTDLGKINEEDASLIFSETTLNQLSEKYFNTKVSKHQLVDDLISYKDGEYKVPLVGGVFPYPQIKLLLQDTKNENIYYVFVDYVFEFPEQGVEREYQLLVKIEKQDRLIIKEINKIEEPIEFDEIKEFLYVE